MICETCRAIVPDQFLKCPACAQRQAAPAMRAFQRDRLLEAERKSSALVVRTIHLRRHVQVFGYALTFCGEPLQPSHRRSLVTRAELGLDICERCRAEIAELLAEATA